MEEDEIGKIFGFVALMGDASLIIGALVFNSMFTPLMKLTGMPGIAYIFGGMILLVPLVILVTMVIVKKVCWKETSPVTEGKHVYSNKGYTSNREK